MNSSVSRDDIIAVLGEIAVLLELQGENDFKTQAYRRAVRDLESGNWDPVAAVVDGTLADRKGFGIALVEKITELVTTGSLTYLDNLRETFPSGLTELLSVPGLGAKRLGRLHRELGIGDATGLRAACEDGRVAALKGFGDASARKILDGIDYVSSQAGRWLLADALDQANRIISLLVDGISCPPIAFSGELARRCETVSSALLVTNSPRPIEFLETLASQMREADVTPVISTSEARLSFRASTGLPVAVVVTSPEREATLRVLASSGPDHVEALKDRAQRCGLDLQGDGLHRGASRLDPANEEEFYGLLDLPFIAPELREDGDALDRATRGLLNPLVTLDDLRGFLHVHTTASDGKNSLEEMAGAIAARGGTYFGVCDHSQASHWAGGLKPDEVRAQHEAIDEWNAAGRSPFILKGIEADILPDGRIDYDEQLLSTFDFVVASVHINFQMSESEMTARILRALDNPLVDILGHPTGRLLLERPGYPVDLDAVAQRAIERDVILEINANPLRLDLAWDRVRSYRHGDLRFSINTDAHSVSGLQNDIYGVHVARRAGLGSGEILNALPLDVLRARFKNRRERLASGRG